MPTAHTDGGAELPAVAEGILTVPLRARSGRTTVPSARRSSRFLSRRAHDDSYICHIRRWGPQHPWMLLLGHRSYVARVVGVRRIETLGLVINARVARCLTYPIGECADPRR